MQDELFAFHKAHFSQHAVSHFSGCFVNPTSRQYDHEDLEVEQWEPEDDLGYYDDGVKRTLTDEQIEIFRHSELEALRKAQEKELDRKARYREDGFDVDMTSIAPQRTPTPQSGAKGSKKKKKSAKRQKAEPKPDLRKRTWDVVEAGLDSLDYD